MMGGVLPLSEQPECISVDVNGLSDITNQSHLTKVKGERERERESKLIFSSRLLLALKMR